MTELDPFAKKPKINTSQNLSSANLEFTLETPDTKVSDPLDSGTETLVPPPLPLKNKGQVAQKASEATRSHRPVLTGLLPEPQGKKKANFDRTPSPTIQNPPIADTTESQPHTSNIDVQKFPSLDNSIQIPAPQINKTMTAVALIPLLPELGTNEEVSQFVARCDTLMGILPDNAQKEMLASFILVKLQGKARKAVVDAAAVTWADMKTALNTLNKSPRLVEDVQTEMSGRTQKPTETVEKFGDAIAILLKELTQAYKSELADGEVISRSVTVINERRAIRAFESGLRNSQLRMMVILSKSATLAEAISCATSYENRLPHPPTKSSPPSSTPTTAAPTCEKCKRVGHKQENCYARNIKTEPVSSTCNYCKQTGHFIADCAQRKENNKRYRGDENYRPPRTVNHTQVNVPSNNQGGEHFPPPSPINNTPSSNPIAFSTNQGNDQRRAGPEERTARIENLTPLS